MEWTRRRFLKSSAALSAGLTLPPFWLRAERAARPVATGSVRMEAAGAGLTGKLVVEAEGIGKNYNGQKIVSGFSTRVLRGDRVGIVGPNYYTSGTNIMSPKALGLKNWEDLRGKPVCGKQGAFYNQIVEERYGAKIIAFTGNAEAKQALRDKKCIAWVYDDSSIGSDLSSGEWDEFEMPLNSEDDNPWALAVPSKERNCVFGRFMSGMQYQWHQDGSLIALEKKWGIKATKYLVDYQARMKDWLAD